MNSFGNAYIAGSTTSLNFPKLRAFQPSKKEQSDAFVAKLSSTGNRLLFSTYMGGDGTESAEGIALGPRGLVYVSGRTRSANFPVKNAYQDNLKGTLDAFVVKMRENDPNVPAVNLLLGLGE